MISNIGLCLRRLRSLATSVSLNMLITLLDFRTVGVLLNNLPKRSEIYADRDKEAGILLRANGEGLFLLNVMVTPARS